MSIQANKVQSYVRMGVFSRSVYMVSCGALKSGWRKGCPGSSRHCLAAEGAEVGLEGPAVDGVLVVRLALVVARVHLPRRVDLELALDPVAFQLPLRYLQDGLHVGVCKYLDAVLVPGDARPGDAACHADEHDLVAQEELVVEVRRLLDLGALRLHARIARITYASIRRLSSSRLPRHRSLLPRCLGANLVIRKRDCTGHFSYRTQSKAITY